VSTCDYFEDPISFHLLSCVSLSVATSHFLVFAKRGEQKVRHDHCCAIPSSCYCSYFTNDKYCRLISKISTHSIVVGQIPSLQDLYLQCPTRVLVNNIRFCHAIERFTFVGCDRADLWLYPTLKPWSQMRSGTARIARKSCVTRSSASAPL
jgi:hypothetical protein